MAATAFSRCFHSSAERLKSSARRFSSRCESLVVPGMGTIHGSFWWLLVVSTIPSAYTYSSCCCSVFCDFMFREANLKRDKNGTKPQENKVRNTIELHAPTVGITLSCTKVQICPVKSEQFYLFLSLTNTFSDYCTTRDNTSTFYIPVYPFSEYIVVP